MNKYPLWKNIALCLVVLLGGIYAAPNLYGEDPAVQISVAPNKPVELPSPEGIENQLKQSNLVFKSIEQSGDTLLVRFKDTENQIRALDEIKQLIGSNYITALNLAPVTPKWLAMLGARALKLGLDLRGGVHFLMEVDIDEAMQRRDESILNDVRSLMREEKIRYVSLTRNKSSGVSLILADKAGLNGAVDRLKRQFPDYEIVKSEDETSQTISIQLKPQALQEIRNNTVEQTITTLRNRVNELGVAEAVVQRQGLDRVVVQLPGIQDTARAKDILGKTATLQFLLEDDEHDVDQVVRGQQVAGSKLYYTKEERPLLLRKRQILSGDSITAATVEHDRDGRPAVSVRVTGSDLNVFKKATRENIGKRMGVVYIESAITYSTDSQGEIVKHHSNSEVVISYATINSALGSNFQITGLSMNEAKDLALFLRAGALPASISIVEERTVGPSLGLENIQQGVVSVAVGMGLVMLFMAAYYSLFGIIANLGLLLNLLFLLSILSMLGATLTLPGIAGIVLTVGMAVDANVLIFERIREELRLGMSPSSSIAAGFDRAMATIVDANLTTLIVGVILFSIGSGPVRGFAITLCLGILTSMFTAITMTRAMVNALYGHRDVQKLAIGI